MFNSPFSSLENSFSSKISISDKIVYERELFKVFTFLGITVSNIEKKLDNEINLRAFLDKYRNGGMIEALKDEFAQAKLANPDIVLSEALKVKVFLQGILALIKSDMFSYLPKSGFLCNRKSIARDWLPSFVDHIFSECEKNNTSFSSSTINNIFSYLIEHHNDQFYVRADESKRASFARVMDQFNNLNLN